MSAMLFVVSAYAQVTTANVAGRVADAQGPVVGAVVTAIHTPTGTQYYSVVDKNGQYRINNILPGGPYTIKVESLGYRTSQVDMLYTAVGETSVTDFVLEDESLALDAVVVSADASDSGMNIRRSGAGTTVSQRTMNNMPTVNRSLNDVMSLTPQASSTTNGLAIGGGTYRGSTVTVDGAAFNNAFGIGSNLPAGGSPISLDAIEQVSVNITPFDVRQSGFQGGAINAVTKSGTNQFSASAYNYYTSEKLRGDKIGEATVTNTEALSNTTGITVGGPIIKNKLFFFVNAEYSLDDVPGSSYEARPNASDVWGKGSANPNYNRPTVAQMDAMKAYVGDKFGYNPGRYQGYSLSTPDYKVLARLDWNINDNNKLNVRFSHTHTFGSNNPSSSMSPIGSTDTKWVSLGKDESDVEHFKYYFNRYDQGRQSQYSMFYEAARYYQETNFTSVAAELNSRLMDGKANNMFRFAWSHQDEPRSFVGDLFPTVDIFSDDPQGVAFGTSGNTAFLTTIGIDPFTYGNLRDVNTFTITDEFTYSQGIHNIIAGAQYEDNTVKNGYMQGGAGWYFYDSWESFKQDVENPSATTGPVAFMITHANLDDPTSQTFPTFNYRQFSLYAQDEITFSDYFKLTAGIRFEVPMISFPVDNVNKDFLENYSTLKGTSLEGLSTGDVPATHLEVSPRIGFNWDILHDRTLVLRGGTGLYTGRIPNVWLVSAAGNSNCVQYQYINKDVRASNASGETNIHFHQNRADVINQLYPADKPFKQQELSAPTGATFIDKNLKMPTSWKTSLAIDAKLPWGIKGTLEGIFNQNFNEVYAIPLGLKKDGTVQLPGEPEAREKWVSEPEVKKVNSCYLATNVNDPGKQGRYYSITAQLSKDFAFGLSAMVAYTHSSSWTLSDGIGDQISEFANTITRNGACSPELGYSGYVSPNRLIANIGYTIKESSHTATKLGLFYEGLNLGFIDSYSYSRVNYVMNNVSGGKATQLIYIPTDAELNDMPFADAANKAAFKDFLASDKYCSAHRGEYFMRNGVAAPWNNRFDLKLAQDIMFNVAGRQQTLELGIDVKNVGNLINSEWGTYKQLSSTSVLSYKDGAYTFSEPVWNTYNKLASTWQMLLSARWFF